LLRCTFPFLGCDTVVAGLFADVSRRLEVAVFRVKRPTLGLALI